MKTSETDKLIVQLLEEDCEKAFRVVFDSYFNRLSWFSHEFVKNKEIAKELAHEAIIRFWEKRNTIAEDTRVFSYLLTTVRNLSLNYLRNLQRAGGTLSFDQNFNEELQLNYKLLADSVWEKLLASELDEILHKSIEMLPERCREVFCLSRLDNLSHKEISEKLNISVKTVEGHISEALKIIRKQMPVYLIVMLYTASF